MSGALNMATNKINNLGTPTVSTDAATKAYVDLTQTASGITGGTITGATLTNDTIDSTPIGSTTRSTVKATTLDLGLSTQSVAIGQGNASIMKNRIINGAMVIDQRNAGASVTPTTGQYLVDRFYYGATQASKFTAQQLSASPPVGFSNYLGLTVASAVSVAAGDTFYLAQAIEGYNIADLGWGTANAKTVTLSFQVYSSLTGTFGGSLLNSGGTRSYPFSYSVPVANTWTTISVTIAGDTSGTWLKTNGIGISVWFGLGSGATFSGTANTWAAGTIVQPTGTVSVVGTNGATFYITGVQLEVGSSATGFEYRQYGQELALCQRYLPAFNFSTSNQTVGGGGLAVSTTAGLINFTFPVTTRVAATGVSVTGTYSSYTTGGGSSGNFTSITLASGQGLYSGVLYCTGSSGLVQGQGMILLTSTAGQILFTGCEL
jgi:hypothetical protein